MKKYIFLTALAAMSLASCSEDVMDRINENHSDPAAEVVMPKFQITDAIMSTGFSTVSGDYSFYVASIMEQELGTGNNQLARAEMRRPSEWTASSTFNNVWNSTYGNLMNIRQIESKINDENNIAYGQYDLLGMAQVLEALNFGILTDMHGDIPYSEAARGSEFMQPKLDSQESIYAGILATLDEAIENLNAGADLNSAGAQDILFNNDVNSWIATAYALKARYELHMSAVDASAIGRALAAANKAVEMGFNGAKITNFNGVDCDNPWSAYVWSRAYTASSNTVFNLMEANDDPRAGAYTYFEYASFDPGDEDVAETSSGYELNFPIWCDLGYQPVTLIGVPEVFFIIAECQARQGADATAAFQSGVAASVEEICTLGDEAVGQNTGWDAMGFAASLGTPDLKMIMEQKYLSQIVDQQCEAWNDYRRCQAMGETFITLTNPNNVQSGVNRLPYLLPYGNSSVLSNPAIAKAYGDGQYVYTTKAWIYNH